METYKQRILKMKDFGDEEGLTDESVAYNDAIEAAAKIAVVADNQIASVRSFLDEVYRQDAKWGQQNHAAERWLTILTEEVGELAEAVLDDDDKGIEEEAIQCAAVAMQMVWSLRRQAESETK